MAESGNRVFNLPRLNVFGARVLARAAPLMERLGRLETELVTDRIADVDTSAPIFVCGLARSGTTILLELLARHRDVASMRYLDFPFVFTPYLWNRYLDRARRPSAAPVERAHGDRLPVSAESPEAMEEPIWMRFFRDCHEPAVSSVLDGATSNPAFEAFYAAHMAKLLLVRSRTRYLAKGNYHVARIAYLKRLYPGARFVIPVRDPVMHVASSMRQHLRFMRGQQESPEARLYLSQAGHFEFGLDRRPINLDADVTRRVLELWQRGEELPGWAEYWAMVHGHLARQLGSESGLADSAMIVSYENLCENPVAHADAICRFCGLPEDPSIREFAAGRVALQRYYEPGFAADEVAAIRTLTESAHAGVLAMAAS